ncbi:reverse transcriptase domain-containing protein [Pelagibacterium mangrovi]|uniref:reverse transcriptase domain-containing protein n=1 Tax=Pelagibacterium mangrovi TaxID=3119828 RepID=UPI002FC69C26
MQTAIKNEIKRLCLQSFEKSRASQEKDAEYRDKFLRRTGIQAASPQRHSSVGKKHRHFDPKYCARHANFLAKTIWLKILNSTYEPTPAMSFEIPKPKGGTRNVMAFSIPDSAVANVVLRRARDRNIKRLSHHSYAYHPHKNVFDAILALNDQFNDEKIFAVQIDFEKYFDNIPAGYLQKIIDDKNFLSLTPHEKHVFRSFWHHRYASRADYTTGAYQRRVKGTPQGSSISLLLANVANHSLDVSLEASAGKFVRFADDVTAICHSYEDAQKIERRFIEHCRKSGLKINEEKSPGLAIIARKEQELRSSFHVDYLGYRFTKDGLTVPNHVEQRIKSKISRLINIYLIYYPNKFGFNSNRLGLNPEYDWDLLGLITELRKYLYGGLDERQIQAFINHGNRLPIMRGLMGFYALIEQKDRLMALDGWLVNVIRRAMKARASLLLGRYGVSGLTPNNGALITGSWLDVSAWQGPEPFPETKLPSLVRGWRAARKHYFTFGLEDVEPPNYY